MEEEFIKYQNVVEQIKSLLDRRPGYIRSLEIRHILIRADLMPKLDYDPNKCYRYTPTPDIYNIPSSENPVL